jgi:hypothetical protein
MKTDKNEDGTYFSEDSPLGRRLPTFKLISVFAVFCKVMPEKDLKLSKAKPFTLRSAGLIGIFLLLGVWMMHPYFLATGAGGDLSTVVDGNHWPNLSGVDALALDGSDRTNITALPTDIGNLPANLALVRGHTGFWRLAKDRTGVWWFLSPDGKLEFLNTVTTVQPMQFSRERNAPKFISRDWRGSTDGEGTEQDLDTWAQATVQRVLSAGFKGLGAWCNPALHRLDIPMSQDLNIWSWIDDASKRLYTADWQASAELAVRTQVAPLRDNKNLVGYYIDNELDWGDGFAGPATYFDHLPPADPNRREVVKVIQTIWPRISDFNFAWGTRLGSWDEVEHWIVLPEEPAPAYDRLSSVWISHLAEDYFRCTTSLIHRYDPNHLILGVRFKGYAPEEVVRASRTYTDAQSLNYYVADAMLDKDMFRMMYHESGQPIVISEYSFHSLDGRSDDPDTVGFSAQVPDQQARADGYRLMTSRLARVPYIVGADWFQWCDEPPGGRSSDGEDVNFGVVDIKDQPYKLLVDAIQETAPKLDALHAQSPTDPKPDVWRDSYADKPLMQVPFLAQPPILDDNFEDWPASAKLTGLRREQTVGIERHKVATPEVYMGWTEQGLYLGIHVFDNHVVTAPANGWWWTRDHVEFWVSTRPVASDQENYDVNCQQFFFVPSRFDENAGIVGQWHRDGDFLKDNLIPHPDVKQATRILPDGYIAEMFIPTVALHGFNPDEQKNLAFNIHVRNFETAADFFWSAPKSAQTQLRPCTWGSLYLSPPAAVPAIAHAAQARAN